METLFYYHSSCVICSWTLLHVKSQGLKTAALSESTRVFADINGTAVCTHTDRKCKEKIYNLNFLRSFLKFYIVVYYNITLVIWPYVCFWIKCSTQVTCCFYWMRLKAVWHWICNSCIPPVELVTAMMSSQACLRSKSDRSRMLLNGSSLTKQLEHISPVDVFTGSPYLPISQRMDFKILLLALKSLNFFAPKYITDL